MLPLRAGVAALVLAGVGGAAAPPVAAVDATLTPRFSVAFTYDRFNVQGSIDQQLASPAIGDVTGDGVADVVVGGMDGRLRVLDSSSGAAVRTIDVDLGGAIQATPTLVNVDGDATLEVLVGTLRRVPGASGVRIYDVATNPPAIVFDEASSPQSNDAGFIGSPVFGDVNGDGQGDVVASGLDQRIHAWRLDGNYLPGFPRFINDTSLSTPALADIDGDGRREIVVGADMDAGQPLPAGGYLWAVNGEDASTVNGYPLGLSTEVLWSSPAVGDLDADGDLDIVIGTGRNFGTVDRTRLYAIDARTRAALPGWPKVLDHDTMPSPALANLDGDAQLEVVASTSSGRLYALEHDGGQRWTTCGRSAAAASCPNGREVAVLASPVVGDVDGDGALEVAYAGEGELVVLDAGSGRIERRASASVGGTQSWVAANAAAIATVGDRTVVAMSTLLDRQPGGRSAGDALAVNAWTTGPAGGQLPWAQWHGGPDHLGTVGAAAASAPRGPGGFTDTAGHTHAANIDKVARAGIAGGFPDGSYRPDAPVSRGQMATFLQKGYRLTPNDGPTFPDAVGTTHEPGIRAVAGAGIATGGTDGRFRPSEAVTRGQMAAFLARAERLDLNGSGPAFCDTAGHPFEREIRAVAAAGIASGSSGCFNPNAPVTRGQMATFLVNALDL